MGKCNVSQQQELHVGQASFTDLPSHLAQGSTSMSSKLGISWLLPLRKEQSVSTRWNIQGEHCNVYHGIKYLQTNEIKLNYKQ